MSRRCTRFSPKQDARGWVVQYNKAILKPSECYLHLKVGSRTPGSMVLFHLGGGSWGVVSLGSDWNSFS